MMMTMMGLGLAMMACGDDDSPPVDPGKPGPAAKVLVRTDAAGDQCAHGGSVVSSGADTNGNGNLEDGEIQVRTPVCNPAPGEPDAALTRLVPEPAGPHCADGGTAIESGVDLDRDGVLDDGEVTHTDYVCGEVLLTRLTPAGARCTAGGVAIEIGRDRDHDGTLADAEVEHTELACGDVLTRDVNATSAADVEALAGIAVIRGNLTVVATFPTVALPKLQVVTGTFDVHGSQVSELSAPELVRVDGNVAILTVKMPALTLPKLASVGGELDIMGNAALTAVQLPALTTVGSHFDFESNALLETITAPVTHIGGALRLIDCPKLTAQDFALDAAPSDLFVRRSGLGTFRLAVSSLFDDRPLDVTFDDNPALASVEVSATRLDKVFFDGHPLLATITLRAQDVTGDLRVRNSAALARLVLDGGLGFHVTGDLDLEAPVAAIDAGSQGVDVGGVATLQGTALTSLAAFAHIGVAVIGGSTQLTQLTLSSADSVIIGSNPALTKLQLSLAAAGGRAEISHNPLLDEVVLGNTAAFGGGLELSFNPKLTAVRGATLTDALGAVVIMSNPLLDALAFPALRRVGGQLAVLSDPALTTLSLPALAVGAEVFVGGNAGLTHLALPALAQVDSISVSNNPHLPACEVAAVFAHVTGERTQSGNDTAASCTP